MKTKLVLSLLFAVAAGTLTYGGSAGGLGTTGPVSTWWNGKYATGSWFGARDWLDDHGVKFGAGWKANFLWNVDGGLEQRGGYDDEWKFRVTIDAAKLLGWDAIDGLSFYADGRYRGGAGVNKYVTTGQFAPSTYQNSRLWRFQNAYALYTTPELFGIRKLLTISGGWQNPSDIFFYQPDSRLFLNNTFASNRGISANSIGWGGSYAAWGGFLKIAPTDWYFLQSGLYVAIPGTGVTSNHGLFFAGGQPPDSNGLYWLTETGVTPRIGPSNLTGKYSAGFLYWGVENTSFLNKQPYDQRVLLYWQVDQQLFRESSQEPNAPRALNAKSFKESVPTVQPKLSDQGLYFFSQINFAPKFDNAEPFYLQTGLVYRGLIPTRDVDQLGVAFGYGNYSYDKLLADEAAGKAVQTCEGVVEFSYRFQVNKWAYVQPDLQYLIRPGGNGFTANATILGFQLGAEF